MKDAPNEDRIATAPEKHAIISDAEPVFVASAGELLDVHRQTGRKVGHSRDDPRPLLGRQAVEIAFRFVCPR
jgi:hypothetical protein